jgi:hypothetical protein
MEDLKFFGTQEEQSVLKLKKAQALIIAFLCHQSVNNYCEIYSNRSQKDWNEIEDWQKISTINKVEYYLNNPKVNYFSLHNVWRSNKLSKGWVYGKVKDIEKKTHPLLLNFKELPNIEQRKMILFYNITDALR